MSDLQDSTPKQENNSAKLAEEKPIAKKQVEQKVNKKGRSVVKDRHDVTEEDILNKSYFKQGLDWYNANFVDPSHQISLMFSIAVLSFFTFFIMFITFTSFFPIITNKPFYFSHSIEGKETVQLKTLDIRRDEDYNKTIARYLVERYIETREGYNPQKIRVVESLVIDLSNDKESLEFIDETSLRNPNSNIYKYGNTAQQTAKITKTSFVFPEEIGGKKVDELYHENYKVKAEVNFETYLFQRGQQKGKVTKWLANIEFDFKNAIVDQETNSFKPHSFKVINYETKQVG